MPIAVDILASLVARYAGPLALFARQWCETGGRASVDDIVQEAFVQLAQQINVPDDPPAWLYRAVRNGSISSRRSWLRRRRREQSAAVVRPDWFQPNDDARLDAAAATEALSQLEGELREIVTAHLWGGLTFDQIAGLVGISSSTAHRRYREGLEQLRNRLERPCRNTN
ncbi:MAG: RNA polymerase sigma factor [Pirellulales bacterium]